MKNIRKCAIMVSLPSFLCVITTCRDYLPFTDEEMFQGEYQQNFIKAFGAIDPNQTWDFSALVPLGKTNEAISRAGENPDAEFTDSRGLFKTQKDLYNDIMDHTQFTSATGQSFAFIIKAGTQFSIYPVYETATPYLTSTNITKNGGLIWGLQVMIDNTAAQVCNGSSRVMYEWPMAFNMFYRPNSYVEDVFDNYQPLTYTLQCTSAGVLSAPIIKYDNAGTDNKTMYLNLHITDIINTEFNSYAAKESQQSSLTGHMRIIDVAHPSTIPDKYETMFIACEAANLDANVKYKYRYRSLVLMLVAPKGNLPDIVYTQENGDERYFSEPDLSKRYMIEDLGSTSDFDFNDIVVDVSQRTRHTVEITKTAATNKTPEKTAVTLNDKTETIATVSHVCGTRPFEIQVGDYTFGLVNDPTDQERSRKELLKETTEGLPSVIEHIIGWDPNVSATITGWNPSINNISVKVWPLGKQDAINGSWQVDFPLTGQVPYIMALPITVPWTDEGIKFDDWQQFTSIGG